MLCVYGERVFRGFVQLTNGDVRGPIEMINIPYLIIQEIPVRPVVACVNSHVNLKRAGSVLRMY